jgi:hypothetical protein
VTEIPRRVAPGEVLLVPVAVVAPAAAGSHTLTVQGIDEDRRPLARACRLHIHVADSVPARLVPTALPRGPQRIPAVLHRVWLGDRPLSDEHAAFGSSFERRHARWEMRLWGDDDLASLGIGRRERALARSASELSDLARVAILARHGGVYVDTDVECLRPLDGLLAGCSAFAGLEAPGRLGSAVMGCVPGHPIFEIAAALSLDLVGLGRDEAHATGPHLITRVFELHTGPGVAVFGSQLFYPYTWDEPERAGEQFPDAYVVHRWSSSWLPRPTVAQAPTGSGSSLPV